MILSVDKRQGKLSLLFGIYGMSKCTFKWFSKSEENYTSKLSGYPCPSLSRKKMNKKSFSFPKDTHTHTYTFVNQIVIANIYYVFILSS